MINNIEYFSAKTLHESIDSQKPIQGTGAIIASHGKYYLVTALHCMRQVDDDDKEIVSPDWKKLSAAVYLQDCEVDLKIKGLLDADKDEDWVIVEIEKPDIDFDYPSKTRLTDTYNLDDTFGAYGFPWSFEDGMELEFTPTNKRGSNWRLKDITEGGSSKANTVEKGCSGMGLYRSKDDVMFCLGIINKSAPGGAFNVMSLVKAKCFASYFPDIYDGVLPSVSNKPAPDLSPVDAARKIQSSYSEQSDMELFEEYMGYMELTEYEKAYPVIEKLFKRYPKDEYAAVNYINTTSLVDASKLGSLQDMALSIQYSTPQSAIICSRAFSRNGYPKTGVDIWYQSALKFNDPEFDCMFYIECLDSDFGRVVHKEYDTVSSGKNVLYEDDEKRRHCVNADTKSLMGSTLIGHHKGDEVIINIAGEDKRIKIIAIHDLYYGIVHRALKDVMEHGGNSIMKPIKLDENCSPEDLLKQLESLCGGESPDEIRRNAYNETPSLVMVANEDDMIGSYYRMLFSDFQLCAKPSELVNQKFYNTLNEDTEFVLDLSSLLILFEKSCAGENIPKKRFILPRFVYELVKVYRRDFMSIASFDMHETLKIGRIHRFNADPKLDMEQRLDSILKWCDDHCSLESSRKVLQLKVPQSDDRVKMFQSAVCLIFDKPNRALLSDDWYIQIMLQIPVCDIKDFFDKIAFKVIN